jgi:hypothetical protein
VTAATAAAIDKPSGPAPVSAIHTLSGELFHAPGGALTGR